MMPSRRVILSMDVPVDVDYEGIISSFNTQVLSKAQDDRRITDWVWTTEDISNRGPYKSIRIGDEEVVIWQEGV